MKFVIEIESVICENKFLFAFLRQYFFLPRQWSRQPIIARHFNNSCAATKDE